MENHIITIKQEYIIENTINKSRFIAHIKPVQTEEEAKAFIETVKKNIVKRPIIVRLTLSEIIC